MSVFWFKIKCIKIKYLYIYGTKPFYIPENVDYTEVSADLNLEDIPVARVQGVIDLLKSSDKYIVFRQLSCWLLGGGMLVFPSWLNY